MDAERPLSHPGGESHRARSNRTTLSLGWLLFAVGLCWLSWPAPAEAQPACAHGICEEGDSLNSGCNGDPCVTAICDVDSYCCAQNGLWDDNCVDQVLTVCQDPVCVAACTHSLCETGDPLESTCNACTAEVCSQNPSCCTTAWDASCVLAIQNVSAACGYQCEPGENICINAIPITPGKFIGTVVGASNDGKVSVVGSNQSADVWYSYTQGEADNMQLSTCETQRSFGIDTVLSVHEGCPGRTGNEILVNDDWRLGLSPSACSGDPDPKNVNAALPLGGFYALDPGETVVIRIAHHIDSVQGNFEFRLLPEPNAWLALVSGAGALGVLARRRRARG